MQCNANGSLYSMMSSHGSSSVNSVNQESHGLQILNDSVNINPIVMYVSMFIYHIYLYHSHYL